MSRTFHHGERRIRVRAIRRERPDLAKLGRALIDLAHAQAEAEAEQTHRQQQQQQRSNPTPNRARRRGTTQRGAE
jgi:hypothetical protein